MIFSCRNQIIMRTHLRVEWGQEEEAVQYLKTNGFRIVNTNHREDCIIVIGERIESEDKDYIKCTK